MMSNPRHRDTSALGGEPGRNSHELQTLRPGGAREDGGGGEGAGRGLLSSTCQLNLSALYGIRGARRGCVARGKGVLGGVEDAYGVILCQTRLKFSREVDECKPLGAGSKTTHSVCEPAVFMLIFGVIFAFSCVLLLGRSGGGTKQVFEHKKQVRAQCMRLRGPLLLLSLTMTMRPLFALPAGARRHRHCHLRHRRLRAAVVRSCRAPRATLPPVAACQPATLPPAPAAPTAPSAIPAAHAPGRGLHSSTFRHNLSAASGIGDAPRGCSGVVQGLTKGIRGCSGCVFVSTSAQAELKSERV
jgi:hypothetical protein